MLNRAPPDRLREANQVRAAFAPAFIAIRSRARSASSNVCWPPTDAGVLPALSAATRSLRDNALETVAVFDAITENVD